MRERFEARRLTADTLGRTVRREKFRVFGLKYLQTLKQLIELKIRNFRSVGLIIQLAVPVDLRSKLFYFFVHTHRLFHEFRDQTVKMMCSLLSCWRISAMRVVPRTDSFLDAFDNRLVFHFDAVQVGSGTCIY